ncbi:MAG TPA: M15 family metallopeptidase [Polyangia bacterium]|nr:M15 family metallopeptidase [Polyangia bacterium]
MRVAVLLCLTLCSGPAVAADPPVGVQALLAAYPEHLAGFEDGHVIWADGTRMPWGEVSTLAGEARFDHSSLADQLAQPYPVGTTFAPPCEDQEPGRARSADFFARMYGATRAEVRSNLDRVPWLPSRGTGRRAVLVTRVNGVSVALGQIVSELDGLAPGARAVAAKVQGGFAWRPVRGTSRPSAHSFGIAIDIGGAWADYWRWTRPLPGGRRPWRNRLPRSIVEIFERHGFIWGGKWHHFDTMHFEYRPELLPR